jgi:hypothetical protein
MTRGDLGSLAWGEMTHGQLTKRQQVRVGIGAICDGMVVARSWLRLFRQPTDGVARADLSTMYPPESRLVRTVNLVAQEQGEPMLRHGRRTVAFAAAIADLDNIVVDDAELLWCACMLHDISLGTPRPHHCFAVRGGLRARDLALEAGADPTWAADLGDAISRHATPRLSPRRHPVPYLVSVGALVDVFGRRLEEMDPRFVDDLLAAETRCDFADLVAATWRAEAQVVPHGRAAMADLFFFSRLARYAPVGRMHP